MKALTWSAELETNVRNLKKQQMPALRQESLSRQEKHGLNRVFNKTSSRVAVEQFNGWV